MKRCPGCGETKTEAAFGRNRATKDGLQTWCKPCHYKAQRSWDKRHPDKKRELGRAWSAANRETVRRKHRARYAADPDRYRAKARARYAKNLERARHWNRRRNLRRYGLSEAEYQARLAAQCGACAICGSPPKRKRLHVDHCHGSGDVRGLLCSNCNLGIGNFQDSPKLLAAAIDYLSHGSFDRSPEE